MRPVRCCPADCAIRSDWQEELQKEIDLLNNNDIERTCDVLKLLSLPMRLKITLLLLTREHCVCEINHVLKEKQNLVSYNLGVLKKYGIVESYYRSKHKYYRLNEKAVNIIRTITKTIGTAP
ncbi:MAG: metalloregulator ArsR/SmtB family transcription factor [Euryarchaeota archaeon]|nr:metalloregulator ArsR/SmtB family transcription factor [Euryarchaeota archaeon]